MKLVAFKYGITEISERMAFQDGNEHIKLPIALLFFLIEDKNRRVLVDVGCDTMPGFELKRFQKPIEVLESYGIKNTDITDIIITHAHHDHIDAIRHYPDVTVHIHKNELKSAEPYFKNINHINLIDEDTIITNNVQFKFIGGHSKGSGIVLISYHDKTYVLCGDECYTKENLVYKKPTGSSICISESKSFVEEYSKDSYIPILFHDPELVPEIGYKILIDT